MKSVTILLTGKRRIVIIPGQGYECHSRVAGQWCLVDADFSEVKKYQGIINALQTTAEYTLAA